MAATTELTSPMPMGARAPGRPPAASRAERLISFDVADFPELTGREEDWRFTPLKRLGGLSDGPCAQVEVGWKADLPQGVHRDELRPGDPALRAVVTPADRVAAFAMERSLGATRVRITPEAAAGTPVHLRLQTSDARPSDAQPSEPSDARPPVAWNHVILDVAPGTEATVVLEHCGSLRCGAAISVLVGDGARLRLVGLQDWDADSVHVVHLGIRLGRDAAIASTQVTLGGDLVRVVETVEYTGPGGDADLAGVFVAAAGQHLEHRLLVDHSVPHCRSDVRYKGVLHGPGAHTVWVGDVLIRAEAEGTDTYELNRNLVLTDGARADSVPNLEIETGEIQGAGHASATGRFDDEQLFYLQSRGIPLDEARRLVVHGFLAETLQRIELVDLRERLQRKVDDELGGAVR
ncbi:MAG: Fe-S cluster assembly protein SufD [Actinomycetota bacterium]|nr:Fe-S cluster assembly protein SufD [Actinomycetota bacterium]